MPDKTGPENMNTSSAREKYDAVPYDSRAIADTHIGLLSIEAILAGLSPALPAKCRVLELGCASGGNLLPMADEFPESEFVGIDISPVQVADGENLRKQAGLNNARLMVMDLCQVGTQLGTFDYIIAHGLYSWIPAPVQAKLLELFATCLNPHGVGYISLNVYPGFHNRQMLRDMLQRRLEGVIDPAARRDISMQFLHVIANTEAAPSCQSMALRGEAKQLLECGYSYFVHDTLAEYHEALYFEDFNRRLTGSGLNFLSECRPDPVIRRAAIGLLKQLPESAGNRIKQEQYIDYIGVVSFRHTAIVKAGLPLKSSPDVKWIDHFSIRSRLHPKVLANAQPMNMAPGVPITFTIPLAGDITFENNISKGIFLSLFLHSSIPLTFEQLLTELRKQLRLGTEFAIAGSPQRQKMAETLMYYRGLGLIKLCWPPGFILQVNEKPKVSKLVRAMAPHTSVLPNRLHETVLDLTRLDTMLLSLMDGNHDIDALCDAIESQQAAGLLPTFGSAGAAECGIFATVEDTLENSLKRIAHYGFLIE